MFGTSLINGNSSNCEKLIVFVTTSDGGDPLDLIANSNTKFGAKIFTYSLGDDADTDMAQQISCDTDAVHFHVRTVDVQLCSWRRLMIMITHSQVSLVNIINIMHMVCDVQMLYGQCLMMMMVASVLS